MSFIRNYMKYANETETPVIYDNWSALATLSSLVSRRVWLPMGHFDIYPNLYVILVGPAGVRKTTALTICERILHQVGDQNFAATCMTKEAVCRYMRDECVKTFIPPGEEAPRQYTPLTMCLTELTHFLGGASAHMIDFLTTIYDRDFYDAKTKNKGDDIIPGPYLVMLACTTPNNITRYLRDDVISGGFSRRALFVFSQQEKRPVPIPVISPEAEAALASCVEWGKKLQDVKGAFSMTEQAKKFFIEWYNELFERLKHHTDPTTLGYYKSKHMQMLKVSMLVSLSESFDMILDVPHMQIALEMLNDVEIGLVEIYKGLGRNELNAISSNLLSLIRASGGYMSEKAVKTVLWREANSQELYSILMQLEQTGQISLVEANLDGKMRRYIILPEMREKLGVKKAGE